MFPNCKQDFRFPSFPHERESSKPLKKRNTRFYGYDDQRFQRKSWQNSAEKRSD